MKLTVVGGTPSQKSGGKVSESQANTGGFDMAMAAVMALLNSNSSEPPSAQCRKDVNPVNSEEINQPSAENESSQKAGDFLQQQGMLPGALIFNDLDGAGTQALTVSADVKSPPQQAAQTLPQQAAQTLPQQMEQTPPQQMEQTPPQQMEQMPPQQMEQMPPQQMEQMPPRQPQTENKIPTVSDLTAESTLKQVEPPGADGRRTTVIADSTTEVLAPKGTPVEPFSLNAKSIREHGEKPVNTGTVLPEASQNVSVIEEGDSVRAAPTGVTSNAENSSPGKAAPGAFTAVANAQASSPKSNMQTGTGQDRGADKAETGKGTVMFSAKIEAGGTSYTGEAKNESGSSNNFSGDASQPNPAQLSSASTQTGPAKTFEGVSLPDLKGVLVQEIKHIYNTHKGEPAQVQIKLEPENLGKLTIKLFYNNGELNAHFYAGNDYVKGILEGSMQQLRESLSLQELVLNQAFVFVGNEESGGSGGRMEYENRQAELLTDRYYGGTDSESKMGPDDYFRPDTDSARVNYLI